MALVEVKVPQLSESVAEATLLQWKKKVGESVARDEVLVEIETDKVVLEVPAASPGVLASIVKPDGSTVVSRDLIATIDGAARAGAAAPVAAPAAVAAPAPAASLPSAAAMPAAAKLAADHGLDTATMAGTGKDGRVTKGDVLAAVTTGAVAPAPVPTRVTTAAPAAPRSASASCRA